MADRQVFQTLGTQLLFHLPSCLSPTLNKKVQTIKSIQTVCFLPALGFKSVAGRHVTGSICDLPTIPFTFKHYSYVKLYICTLHFTLKPFYR